MDKIVNLVTSVHLKHAYFPRIGSQIDMFKDAALTRVTELWKTERDWRIEPVSTIQ